MYTQNSLFTQERFTCGIRVRRTLTNCETARSSPGIKLSRIAFLPQFPARILARRRGACETECVRAWRTYVSKPHLPSDADAERQPPTSVKVLIVDDHEPWRRWVYRELGKQQQLQIVGEASDGLEAVRKAHELKPDLILLDIGLPNLNGLEAASQITQSTP